MLGFHRFSSLLKTGICVKKSRKCFPPIVSLSVSKSSTAAATAKKLLPVQSDQLFDIKQLKSSDVSMLLNNLGFSLSWKHNFNGLDLSNVEKTSDLANIVDSEIPIQKFQALMKYLDAFKVLGVPKCLLDSHSIERVCLDYSKVQILEGPDEQNSWVFGYYSVLSANQFVATSSCTLCIWNADTGECEQVWDDKKYGCRTVVLSDGRIVNSSSRNDGHRIHIYDPKTKLCVQKLDGHEEWIQSLVVLPDNTIASGSRDHTIRLWNPDTGVCLKVLECDDVSTLCAIRNDILAAADSRGEATIHIWNIKTGECKKISEGHTGVLHTICKLPDGCLVSGGSDKCIRIWNVETGVCERVFLGHTDAVIALDVLPDGRLVSASFDKTIRIWNTTTGACEYLMETEDFTADSMMVLNDGRIVYSIDHELFIRG